MDTWKLRDASAADVDQIAELRAAVLRDDLERLGRYDAHRVRQRLRDGFDPSCTQIVEVDGVFAGCVALRPADDAHRSEDGDADADAHWLEHFYLAPRLHGRGIGSAVLRHLLDTCDQTGTRVRLNVLQGSPARRLYERHGFRADAEDAVDVFMVRDPTTVSTVAR